MFHLKPRALKFGLSGHPRYSYPGPKLWEDSSSGIPNSLCRLICSVIASKVLLRLAWEKIVIHQRVFSGKFTQLCFTIWCNVFFLCYPERHTLPVHHQNQPCQFGRWWDLSSFLDPCTKLIILDMNLYKKHLSAGMPFKYQGLWSTCRVYGLEWMSAHLLCPNLEVFVISLRTLRQHLVP